MADDHSLILQVIHQIIATQLPSATERVVLRLLAKVNPHCGQVNLTWEHYLRLCAVATRGGSRHHLVTLKRAKLIHYSTTNDYIYITFLKITSGICPDHQPAMPCPPDPSLARTPAESPKPGSPVHLSPRVQVHAPARDPEPALHIGSLGLGLEGLGREESESLQTGEGEKTLQALALSLLGECGVVKEPEKLARTVPFNELRAIALRWRLDQRANGPGSLIYRIIHRHTPGWDWQLAPLTATEYCDPFIQRWRTDEEIKRDEQAPTNVLCEQQPSTDFGEPASELGQTLSPVGFRSPPLSAGEKPTLILQQPPSAMSPINARPAAPLTADQQIWQAILNELEWQMPKASFTTWLAGATLLNHTCDAAGDQWRIGLPNHFALDWVKNRLAPKITRALSAHGQKAVQLHLEVNAPNRALF